MLHIHKTNSFDFTRLKKRLRLQLRKHHKKKMLPSLTNGIHNLKL
jgi:hypothetical protein